MTREEAANNALNKVLLVNLLSYIWVQVMVSQNSLLTVLIR